MSIVDPRVEYETVPINVKIIYMLSLKIWYMLPVDEIL